MDTADPRPPAHLTPEELASDEKYWARIAALYDVTDEVIQLENGNWGVMAREVLDAYQQNISAVNRRNSFYHRQEFPDDLNRIQEQAAAVLGVSSAEIEFTRNATEALHRLIRGYSGLRPGDAVLCADHDYDTTIPAMQWLREHRGVDVVHIVLPEPATRQGIIEAYTSAFASNPRIRLVLLTHLGHRSGLVIPVAEIVDVARAHGADVIVDAAHSAGHLDFSLRDLNAPFIGLNLHKWFGAPLGIGVMYVRNDRSGDIEGVASRDVSLRRMFHGGAVDIAAWLTVPNALQMHARISPAVRLARLQYLRDAWVHPVLDLVDILTPEDRSMYGAITSFRRKGQREAADNIALAKTLLDAHGIFTVARNGLAGGACVRVTPALYNSVDHVHALRDAILFLGSP